MNEEEFKAYEWAINNEFQSVAARHARTLALYIQRMENFQRKPLTFAEKVLQYAKDTSRTYPTRLRLIKAMKDFCPDESLVDARKKVEELYSFLPTGDIVIK